MKRLVRTMLLSTLAMSTLTPVFAQEPVAPTVPLGSFHCFRGMPLSDINYVESHSERPNIFRGNKLGNSKWDNTDGHDLREVTTEGKLKVMVIIVNFEDTKFSQKANDPNSLITEMLNGEDFTFQNATGSANHYYRTISNGQFDPQFDVYGPIDLSKKSIEYVTPQETPATNPDGYYIDPSTGKQVQKYPASRAVEEAIMALKDRVNFADYDSNGDGYVDFVYMFYAGKGATTGGNRYTTIWPHAFTLTAGLGAPIELNGVKIDRYACSAELGANNRLSGIGTFCHEFGHVLGLPDIYDTANNGSVTANFTAGPFTCMDAGNYNNDEHTPPYFSSYEQYAMEWMLPMTVTGGGHFTLLPLGARKFAYKFNTSNPQEYFLMEARDKHGLDYYLPCHGMAVWHIDFNLDIWKKNTPNNNDNHQRIDLIEADNDRNTSSRDGDLFPGIAGICSFTENISPSFIDWNNRSTGYNINEIKRNFDGTVSFECVSSEDKVMDGADIAVPALEVIASTPNSLTISFPEIDNATEYFVSAYPADKFDGSFINEYVDGYYYHPALAADGYVTLTIEGLNEGVTYGLLAYAANGFNASRTATPLYASAISDTFENARTDVFAWLPESSDSDEIIINWMPVTGATDYDLTIIQRAPETTAEEIADEQNNFTGNQMPEGWNTSGTYDNRDKYSGQNTPSLQLAYPGSYLSSPLYKHQIKNVSFWVRNRFAENLCNLDIYGLRPDGSLQLVKSINDLSNKGSKYSIDFPAGLYGVKFIYSFTSTGLDCNIDDVTVQFADSFSDIPVSGLNVDFKNETTAVVTGLKNDTEYVAYVTPKRGDEAGLRSNELVFNLSGLSVSGIEEISGDDGISAGFTLNAGTLIPADNEPYSVYAVDGTCIAKGITGVYTLPQHGLYIVSSMGKSHKICW